MSVVAHGVDLVECSRIARLLADHEDRFLARILTDRERDYARSLRFAIPHVSGRFAAKEAILKVMGTGWRGQIAWTDMEILNDSMGRPLVTLSGECSRIATERGIARILVSISHTDDHAIASAIGLSD